MESHLKPTSGGGMWKTNFPDKLPGLTPGSDSFLLEFFQIPGTVFVSTLSCYCWRPIRRRWREGESRGHHQAPNWALRKEKSRFGALHSQPAQGECFAGPSSAVVQDPAPSLGQEMDLFPKIPSHCHLLNQTWHQGSICPILFYLKLLFIKSSSTTKAVNLPESH